MTLQKGSATKRIRDAITAEEFAVASADITDATVTGQALLTAASAAAARTALGTPALVSAPGTATSAGVAGSIAYDATHIYVCVATNTWVRATLATF